ncbi:zinc finger protein 771 [Apis florea]|uniref:zinc finger protein 771 n=1 Tax=Apis florea TaxID=7463 RepID=UPI000629813E|nr:zinc finger protein 771 [Apis florea]
MAEIFQYGEMIECSKRLKIQCRTHLQKVWFCFQCGKRYQWRGSLKSHIRVECGKEPTFTCPISTSKKLWLCFQCGKRYMWKDSLKKHLRVECGKEPTYECPICGRKFKHKHRWQSHARLIHYLDI